MLFRSRLPNQWGKLGLEKNQKDAIYKIIEKFEKEINDLEEKLDAVKRKKMTEMRKVLTAEQRKHLSELTGNSDSEPVAKPKGDPKAKADPKGKAPAKKAKAKDD